MLLQYTLCRIQTRCRMLPSPTLHAIPLLAVVSVVSVIACSIRRRLLCLSQRIPLLPMNVLVLSALQLPRRSNECPCYALCLTRSCGQSLRPSQLESTGRVHQCIARIVLHLFHAPVAGFDMCLAGLLAKNPNTVMSAAMNPNLIVAERKGGCLNCASS